MLRLVELSPQYYPLLLDMMEEWTGSGEKIVPYAVRKRDYKVYDSYVSSLELFDNNHDHVPNSTYFALDEERNLLVGAVNIRHYLKTSLLRSGGHISDGVRPSERRKGFATQMIALSLEKCKKLKIPRVLLVCDKTNLASAKSILNNGGVLEDEIEVDGVIEQRYWITLAATP